MIFIRLAFFLIAMLAAPAAFAGAFYIQEQSVSNLGTAFAGAVADTPDASTIFYNPAGMTDLAGPEFSLGVNLISPTSYYSDRGSRVSSVPGTGGASVPLSGNDGGDPFDYATVPNVYFAFPLSEDKKFWAGIGVTAPFGLANEYEDDYAGRYDSTENQLTTIDVAPSVAYAPWDFLSMGFGINIQQADAKLESAVPSPITAGGPVPATDGLTDLSGDDVTVGFNAGLIVKPFDSTRMGAHYRQGISHTLEGRLITRIPRDVPGVGGTFTRTGGKAELDLPSIISFGISQQVNERLKILFSATWHEWQNFDDIVVQLDNGASSQALQNYRNTWAFALGARYQMSDKLMLKAGFQYDPTPTQDHFRSTRIPDGDRTWITTGAAYDFNDKLSLDLGAAYIHVSQESILLDGTVPIGGGASTTYNLRGEVEGSVGIAAAALRYRF